jgi:hypothetical protein
VLRDALLPEVFFLTSEVGTQTITEFILECALLMGVRDESLHSVNL